MTFAAELHRHGDRPAVITAQGTVSYEELAERVDAAARDLGSQRRLVLVEAANDVTSLVGYLAALRGGHVAMLAPRSAPEQVSELIEAWDPDVVIGAGGSRPRRSGSRHHLHPELTLLLATSGSTGRPRLVRISTDALDANAAAISEYLAIRPDDRAMATLPMHYCYGLSVINSNLRSGAALILDDRSVTDPGFWATVREQRATSLHGVPHSFELLERVGFPEMELPHLRYITQAGGRLAAPEVRRWAELGRARGWELYVMYGQTEATARMAYLPPTLAAKNPETIGIAIPGGTLSIEPVDDECPLEDGVGEIVYRGPNVMLGYAETIDDLARGRTVDALHTGDLGRIRADGLVEIRGRRSRFVKPFGVRVDLDRLERLLLEEGLRTAATGTDDHLVIAVERDPSTAGTGGSEDPDAPAAVRAAVHHRLHLPASVLTVVTVDELPRRTNGKIDHPAVARLAESGPAARGASPTTELTAAGVTAAGVTAAGVTAAGVTAAGVTAAGSVAAANGRPTRIRRVLGSASRRRAHPLTVREVFARTFPGQTLRDDATFVDLGDSLTYVQVSADLERALGHLPQSWDTIGLGELVEIEHRSRPARSGHSWLGRAQLEAVVLLRAAAIVLVVGEHTHLWSWLGGAHLLLAISGWTFARFVLSSRQGDAPSTGVAATSGAAAERGRATWWLLPRRILHSAALIAVPSSLWIAFRATTQNDVHYVDALLMGSVFHPLVQGYWFVGALVQILLVMAALFAVPVIRRLDRRYRFGLPLAVLGVAQLLRFVPERADTLVPDLYSTHLVAWLFVLGWVIQRASTPAQRWTVALLTVTLIPSFFGSELERAVIVGGGLLVLMFVDRLSVPRPIATLASTLATASLGIYLTHFALLPLQYHGVRPALLVPLALVVGVCSWWIANAAVRWVVTTRRVRHLSPADGELTLATLGPPARHHPTRPQHAESASAAPGTTTS